VTGKNNNQSLPDNNGKFPIPGQLLQPGQADAIRAFALSIALLPLLVAQPSATLLLALSVVLVAIWNALFVRSLRASIRFSVLFTGVLLTLLMPQAISWWVFALCVSFGIVFGEQIYGGRTYSFLSPVIVALAFLFFAFPVDTAPLIDSLNSAWLLVPIVILLLYQQLDWLTLLGACLGMLILFTLIQDSNNTLLSLVNVFRDLPTSIALMAIFILGDTVLTARTPFGKLLSGMLSGVLYVYLSPEFLSFESAIFSVLLALIAIPLIDWLVLATTPQTYQAASFRSPR